MYNVLLFLHAQAHTHACTYVCSSHAFGVALSVSIPRFLPVVVSLLECPCKPPLEALPDVCYCCVKGLEDWGAGTTGKYLVVKVSGHQCNTKATGIPADLDSSTTSEECEHDGLDDELCTLEMGFQLFVCTSCNCTNMQQIILNQQSRLTTPTVQPKKHCGKYFVKVTSLLRIALVKFQAFFLTEETTLEQCRTQSPAMDYFKKSESNGYWSSDCSINQGNGKTFEECAQECLDYGSSCGGFEVYKPGCTGDCWETRSTTGHCYIFTQKVADMDNAGCTWTNTSDCKYFTRK